MARTYLIVLIWGVAAAARTFGNGQLKLDLDDDITPQLSEPLKDCYGNLPVVLWHGMGKVIGSSFTFLTETQTIRALFF